MLLELSGGMGRKLVAEPGSVPVVGERILLTTLSETFRPGGAFPDPAETPWTHGGPPVAGDAVSGWLVERMREWTAADHRLVLTVTTDEYRCASLAFSPDGNLLALGKSNGMVGIWDLAVGQPVKHFLHDLCGDAVTAIAFSAGRPPARHGRQPTGT